MPKAINIILDGPPSPLSGRFVEVETDDGRSINAGEWIERSDGLWALRITELPDSAFQQIKSGEGKTVCEIHDYHNLLAIDGYKLCPACNVPL